MPEMNGFELLANIRANPIFNNIPVIILTGADLTPEQHQQLTDSGQHLLSKGFLREKELLNSLDVALRQIQLPTRKAA
jgi:CheY-like chemotaxis protein